MKKLVFIVLTLFLGACSYDYVTVKPEPVIETKVSFATEIQPIFTAHCIACHSGSTAPNLSEGKSYDALTGGSFINTSVPKQSKLYTEINSGDMPFGGTKLEQGKIDTVLAWIEQGALNN